MYKIAVLGPYDSIYGLAMLGFDTFPASDAKTGITELKRLAEENYAIIYVTEGLAASMQTEIEKYREQLLPAIILIPGISDNTGEGIESVKKCVEQAVGSDILFSGN